MNPNQELIDAIYALKVEIEELRREVKGLRNVNDELSSKLYSINEHLSTMDR